MIQFISHLDGGEVEWILEQGTLYQSVEILSQNTINIEELSEKQDGQKLECKAKEQGMKAEFNLLVICEYNLESQLEAS